MTPKTTVFYHANCMDGAGAAYAAHCKFGDAAEYLPVSYPGTSITPEAVKAHHVYMVDFSVKLAHLLELAASAQSVTIIDHHKTAAEDLVGQALPDNVHLVFDDSHSGCVLAWRFFCPQHPVPDVLCYIQDRDLWRFGLPYSRAMNRWISSNGKTIKGVATSVALATDNRAVIRAGQQLLEADQVVIDDQVARLRRHTDTRGLHVMTGTVTVMISESASHALAQHPDVDYTATFFTERDGTERWSLRSRAGSDIDVSAIAKLRGGGGHKHAAGFEMLSAKINL